jgi:DNA-directed RNA polymerase specialized sigma24 family protein
LVASGDFSVDTDIDLAKLQENIHDALKAWHKPNDDTSPFGGLQIFQQIQLNDACNTRQVTNKILFNLLETLENADQERAQLLSRRFLDGEKMRLIANSLNVSEATAYRKQNEAIEQLARMLQTEEIQTRNTQRTILEAWLERPTYTQLIGVEDHLDKLLDLLTSPGSPWLISITGLGGIGKTSLADALSRQIIRRRLFDGFGWVSARQQIFKLSGQIQPVKSPVALTTGALIDTLVAQLMSHLPKPDTLSIQETQILLQTHLKRIPHLIVIDNLETVQDVEELLPALRDLINPSKILLTSRESLYHEPDIYHFSLPELSEVDTLRLIHHEIELRNLTHLQQTGDDDLKKIYKAVGGNPLAIRLVIGQTHVFALNAILDDLAAAQSRTVDELYTFIYRQAWDVLDEPARELFLAMPLITEAGESIEELAELSELDIATVHTSLKRLVDLNLVNSSGDHTQRHYSIHNLTRTFLHNQVLKWKL